MTLREYIAVTDRRKALVDRLETSDGYLWQLATRWRGKRPSVAFAKRIEKATDGVVKAAPLLGLSDG